MKARKTFQEAKIKSMLKNKTILITGGAGSIGSGLTKKLLEYPVKQIRVFDVNEYALFVLKREINDKRLRFLLGNILDKDRLEMAANNVDIVIHSAAVKNIEISEFNALDTVDVNVNGTVNLIKTVIKEKPDKFLNISTDKVVDNSTLYGTTKQIGERLTVWAGQHIQSSCFASLRFGNVIESRGNVFEVWKLESENKKPLSITHPEMRRYFFHLNDVVMMILQCLNIMKQGEIYIPKMKSYKLKELASKYSKKQKIIGLRPGEKMEEKLMTDSEKTKAIDYGNMWIIKSNYKD